MTIDVRWSWARLACAARRVVLSTRKPLGISLVFAASTAAIAIAACDSGGGGPSATDPGTVTPTGCSGTRPATAPNGYYVSGNTVCSPSGTPHLLHGVDRPSLEWAADGQYLSADDFKAMAGWHANVVRIALNQDFWLSAAPQYVPTYQARVKQAVQWAEEAGIDVILDLHWNDRGFYGTKPGQQEMADLHSIDFWKEVATIYKDDGRVFFELYNEPHDVPAYIWLSGGLGGNPAFQVAGMQQLYDAVRGVGANNLVIAGGLDYAFDLSHVSAYPIKGYNVLYATHPYNTPERQPTTWWASWGYLTKTAPVVVTEFGNGGTQCSGDWDTQLIAYADKHSASWTAWAWWSGGCSFPSLLSNWTGGTTAEGAVVKAALLGYHDPAAPSPDGGTSEPDGSTDMPDAGSTDDGSAPSDDGGTPGNDGGTDENGNTDGGNTDGGTSDGG